MTEKTLGKILQEARIAKNIEIAKICSYLKVKPHDIEEIEQKEIKSCNTYKIGLIRSYAKFLKIENDVIEEKIKNISVDLNTSKKKHQLVNIGEDIEPTPNREMFANFIVISLLVFILFLLIYNIYENNSRPVRTGKLVNKVEKIIAKDSQTVSDNNDNVDSE